MPAFPAKATISAPYPNPSNAVARQGLGDFYDATTGLLGTTGDPVDARAALGIGSAISFRNLLINGNFAVNQRGYASGAATTGANQYTLDRWRIPTSGQSATFAAGTPDRTVTFPASGGEQVVEGASIVGGTYTLSWTGAATAKVNGAAVANGGNVVLPANTNATVQFVGAVTRAQLELGTVATPYERRPLTLELQLCQRYYFRLGGAVGIAVGSGVMLAATEAYIYGALPVTMRAQPSVTINFAGFGLTMVTNGVLSNTGTVGVANSAYANTYALDFTATVANTANGGVVVRTATADQFIAFTAEL